MSESKYREIFVSNFNISPFHPKKDQCLMCETWQALTDEQRRTRSEEKLEHDNCREQAQTFKQKTKEECQNDPSRRMATFDLEAVLQLPCGQVSQLYYKRKLVVYKFTVYESPGGQGSCFLWNEVEKGKGSDEVGSCLLKYFMALPDEVSKVDVFSDNCGGQNKNIQVVAACLYAVNNIDHLVEITHTFLETGHTHMECDSMHAAIEHAKKNVKVHSMGQWEGILSMARRKKPYQVIKLLHGDFYDLKALVKQLVLNKSKDSDGLIVNWRKVRSLRYQSSLSNLVAYKYSLPDSFRYVDISKSRKVHKPITITLQPKYKKQLPISKAKKDDLIELCTKNVIDKDYHAWYAALPVAAGITDKVPLPAVDEETSTGE